jgi:hypothetical protein
MAPRQHAGLAPMDADPARCSARCQCFDVMVKRKCSLGTSQTLSDKISEHPEFGAARGCRPPRVRNGLSGESGRITTLRVEASSESTAIWGISVMPSSAATIWTSVRRLVAWKTSLANRIHDPTCLQ